MKPPLSRCPKGDVSAAVADNAACRLGKGLATAPGRLHPRRRWRTANSLESRAFSICYAERFGSRISPSIIHPVELIRTVHLNLDDRRTGAQFTQEKNTGTDEMFTVRAWSQAIRREWGQIGRAH